MKNGEYMKHVSLALQKHHHQCVFQKKRNRNIKFN